MIRNLSYKNAREVAVCLKLLKGFPEHFSDKEDELKALCHTHTPQGLDCKSAKIYRPWIQFKTTKIYGVLHYENCRGLLGRLY